MISKFDQELIEALQEDGRTPFTHLSEKFKVVEGTIRRRVNNLLKKRIIKIVAAPNMRELGFNFVAIMGIQINMTDLRKVADALVKKPNVCYLAYVAGQYDLMAVIMTRSPQDLAKFIEEEIATVPSVLRTETFVNLDIIKGGWLGLDTSHLISSIETSKS